MTKLLSYSNIYLFIIITFLSTSSFAKIHHDRNEKNDTEPVQLTSPYFDKPFEFYIQEANSGKANAQHRVALMYFNGEEVEKNPKKALEWFHKAANHGLASAQQDLGIIYANGYGVSIDQRSAFEWFHKAADQGLAESQHNLGSMYASGYGVTRDLVKASEWFNKAAVLGNVKAMVSLARIYNDGLLGKRNLLLAYIWFDLAGKHGIQAAHLNRDEVAKDLTQSDIKIAIDIARNWTVGKVFPDLP
jgi:TPR repeat protein